MSLYVLFIVLAMLASCVVSTPVISYNIYNQAGCQSTSGTSPASGTFIDAGYTNGGSYTASCVFVYLNGFTQVKAMSLSCTATSTQVILYGDSGCTNQLTTATGGGSGMCMSIAGTSGSAEVSCSGSSDVPNPASLSVSFFNSGDSTCSTSTVYTLTDNQPVYSWSGGASLFTSACLPTSFASLSSVKSLQMSTQYTGDNAMTTALTLYTDTVCQNVAVQGSTATGSCIQSLGPSSAVVSLSTALSITLYKQNQEWASAVQFNAKYDSYNWTTSCLPLTGSTQGLAVAAVRMSCNPTKTAVILYQDTACQTWYSYNMYGAPNSVQPLEVEVGSALVVCPSNG